MIKECRKTPPCRVPWHYGVSCNNRREMHKTILMPKHKMPLSILSPCVSVREYRGSTQRARGLEYKQDPPIPPLSGGEVARKTEEKGRGLSERSEFRRPRRRLRRRTQKPDNSGGASWFVLLAVEKNEQIKRISVTRTFFGRERKSFVAQSSPCRVPQHGGVFLHSKI